MPTIQIKAVARYESVGTFANPCMSCPGGTDNLIEACTIAGADVDEVKSLLQFEFRGIKAFPLIEIDTSKIAQGLFWCERSELPYEWFIFGCIKFGIFKLSSTLVAARNFLHMNPLLTVKEMLTNPEMQILEFVHQFQDAKSPDDKDFTDTAQTWRTGSPLRTEGDYGTVIKKQYNELRLMGHEDA